MSKDTTINITSLTKEEQQFITERKLDDKYFIGRFNEKESGYLVSDIRRSDFSKIKYKPENSEAFTIEVDDNLAQNIKDDCYYRFSWIMVKSEPNYVFEVDTKLEITPVLPKDIVNMLYKDMYNCDPRASQMIVNTLDTIKNQLTASGKEVFIYELLQNANDYPQKVNEQKIPVEVVFHITDNYLIFQHSGDYFNAKNIEAICSIMIKKRLIMQKPSVTRVSDLKRCSWIIIMYFFEQVIINSDLTMITPRILKIQLGRYFLYGQKTRMLTMKFWK